MNFITEYCTECERVDQSIIKAKINLQKYKEEYLKLKKPPRTILNTSPEKLSADILRILTSNKYSMHSSQMNGDIRDEILAYIERCVLQNTTLHIGLAGMPGKCANNEKVNHRHPDLAEFTALLRLEEINDSVKSIFAPGVRFTFFSDYVGLFYSFYPIYEDIQEYLNQMRKWVMSYQFHVDIRLVTEILPGIKEFMDKYLRDDIYKAVKNSRVDDMALYSSMKTNINFDNAKIVISKIVDEEPDEEQVLAVACDYYLKFWDYWNSQNAVKNYFGEIIYGSPVAFHPKKRLCIRLLPKASRQAPWNGVGFITENGVICLAENKIDKKQSIKLLDSHNRVMGYLPEKRYDL